MSEYPECDRLSAISDQSQIVGDFLDWANEQHGMLLAVYVTKPNGGPLCDCRDEQDTINPNCEDCGGSGFLDGVYEWPRPIHVPVTTLLAEFFEIDMAKVEDERRGMLEALRASA